MKLDLGSWSENLKLESGHGTPSWGTALGQGKDYAYSFEDQDDYFRAMEECSIMEEYKTNQSILTYRLGKGKNKQKDYKIIRAALFEKVYIHIDTTTKLLNDAKFVILEVEELTHYHKGRKTIKYSKHFSYTDPGTGIKVKNEDCFNRINQQIRISEQEGWFVGEIQFKQSNELHLYIYVLDKCIFQSVSERKNAMKFAMMEKVNHYTSLKSAIEIISGVANDYFRFRATRSDCLNDPNECLYVDDMNKLIPSGNKSGKAFILSFSNSCDNPVMWRLYNSYIQFVFDKNEVENALYKICSGDLSYKLGDVVYENLKSKYSINTLLNVVRHNYKRIGKKKYLKEKDIPYFIKDRDYQIEDEWRVVVEEPVGYQNSKDDLNNKVLGVSLGYDIVKWYRDINIPIKALRKIIVYEFNDKKFSIISSQIKDLLNVYSMDNVEIVRTRCVEFRTK